MKAVFVGILLGISLTSCSCSGIKLRPEYKGVDPRVQELVNEYKELAKTNGITFKNEVTIGFKKLSYGNSSGLKKISSADDNNIIGLCTYGLGWREIDISEEYWKNASDMSRKILIFHENSHCFCDRDHDFESKPYPESYSKRESDLIKMIATGKPLPGYYEDMCPKSLMYPEILEDYCSINHKEDYEKEMFQNCQVW